MSDTGVGMDAEALARVFEPYFSTKTTGTGLGLPIAKRNIELNGGTIAVTSERDQGTTVEVTLPVADLYEPSRPRRPRSCPGSVRSWGLRCPVVDADDATPSRRMSPPR